MKIWDFSYIFHFCGLNIFVVYSSVASFKLNFPQLTSMKRNYLHVFSVYFTFYFKNFRHSDFVSPIFLFMIGISAQSTCHASRFEIKECTHQETGGITTTIYIQKSTRHPAPGRYILVYFNLNIFKVRNG